MKKIYLFLMLILGLSSQAQNLIGYSFSDVKKEMNKYTIEDGYTDYNVCYLMAYDDDRLNVYYFSDNNKCVAYKYTIYKYTLADLENELSSDGYVLYKDKTYRNNSFISEIKWEKSINGWSVLMTPNIND